MPFSERLIRVEIIEHRAARMLLGISDDLRDLYVQGRTEEEIESRIPRAIKAIFEAEGRVGVDVKMLAASGAEEPTPGVRRMRKFAVAA